MNSLLAGIFMFFGIHSISIFAPQLRDKLAAKNEYGWKAIYAVISVAGLVFITQGYAELKLSPTLLYVTPSWFRHLSALLMLPIFILFLAPYFPGKIKTVLKHPQLIAVKLWAVSHLLVNGALADVLLFGTFLIWAIVDRVSMKQRAPRSVPGLKTSKVNDAVIIVIGLSLYILFILYVHETLIGVSPFAPAT
jgi:uncharacterized membrane protein